MYAMLTTTVANYVVEPEQYAEAREAAYQLGNDAHFSLTNNNGEYIQSIGNRSVVPSIWTHTPVPMGLDIIALKQRFEERAASVLGDYDTVVNFDLCGQYDDTRTNTFGDNRYIDPTLRAAWMMYVDQAIEHFNNK